MIPALKILGALFLVLVGSILGMARAYRDREIGDGGLGIGLVMLLLSGLALLVVVAWMADLLLFLCVGHP